MPLGASWSSAIGESIPKAKPPPGRHFAQCPAGGLKRPQNAPALRPFCGDTREGRLAKGNEMRAVLAALVALTVLYFVDKDFNHGNLLDGLDGMLRAISRSMLH